eukprot:m.116318 g.116318  ORF g.116318 m.116318 type:complete len:88 (+) comp17175_c0_seq4:890-1153(+)
MDRADTTKSSGVFSVIRWAPRDSAENIETAANEHVFGSVSNFIVQEFRRATGPCAYRVVSYLWAGTTPPLFQMDTLQLMTRIHALQP